MLTQASRHLPSSLIRLPFDNQPQPKQSRAKQRETEAYRSRSVQFGLTDRLTDGLLTQQAAAAVSAAAAAPPPPKCTTEVHQQQQQHHQPNPRITRSPIWLEAIRCVVRGCIVALESRLSGKVRIVSLLFPQFLRFCGRCPLQKHSPNAHGLDLGDGLLCFRLVLRPVARITHPQKSSSRPPSL